MAWDYLKSPLIVSYVVYKWTLGRLLPILKDFLVGAPLLRKLKNNQKLKIGEYIFGRTRRNKNGRVWIRTCHFYNLALSIFNLICYLKCISSFSWRCKGDEWQIKWKNEQIQRRKYVIENRWCHCRIAIEFLLMRSSSFM